MSLEKKVAIGFFALNACAPDNYVTTLNGVRISEATTDSEGKAYFREEETGEEVEVSIDPPVADANIIYFDNFLSEGFLLFHPAFAPQLQIALHNSNHHYSLTPAPLQILHNGNEKEQSRPGAQTYLSWAEANWEHTGCVNRDQMITLMKPGAYLMKKLGIIETLGFGEEYFDDAVQYIEDNLPESAVAETYVFIPSRYGFKGTTTITALEVKFEGGCTTDSENNTNNNPPTNNQNNTDCSGMLFCDYFSGTVLDAGKWNVINDSGIEVSGGKLSLLNTSSIAAQHGFGNSCADKRVDLRSGSYLGSVYLGNMGLSAANDTGILSCGEESAILNIAGAENGISLYKSGGTLSALVDGLETSIPCLEEISYVQLTTGLNDLAEYDYVEVNCK